MNLIDQQRGTFSPAAGLGAGSEIIHAVFPSRRGLLPSFRSLVDFLAARFREIDEE